MTRSVRRRVVELPAKAREEVPTEVETSPLYGVAMLKMAMELKKPNAPALEEILSGVLKRMNLSEEAFRHYLEQNGGLLKAIAQKRQY